MEPFARELRHAVREIQSRPGFAATVILSLALGIGANTTVFAWLDTIVSRPLPGVPDSDQLVALNVADGRGTVEGMAPIAYPTLQDWMAQTTVFDSVAAHAQARLSLRVAAADNPEPRWTEITAAGFFRTLGVRPAAGRFFDEADERAGSAVVVLSHAFWQRRFGGASDVIGRDLLFNGLPLTVIGIGPPGFGGVVTGLAFDAFVPLWQQMRLLPGSDWQRDRGARRMQAIARLRPEVDLAEAQRALNGAAVAISSSLGEWPVTGGGARWLSDTQLGSLVGPLGRAMIAVTLVVLLAACANVAGLLLARAAGREREAAIQVALGASRGRLVRPALVEAGLLSALGLGVAICVATVTKDALRAFIPRVSLPVSLEVALSWRVVLVAAGLAVVGALLCAVAPALRASRPDVARVLTTMSGSIAGHRSRLRRALVVAQVACAVMALATAGLFLRSLTAISAVPLGLDDPARVLLVSTDLSFTRQVGEARARLVDRALDSVRGLPGVGDATLASFVPLSFGGPSGVLTRIEGYAPRLDEPMFVARALVTDRYFETMGIDLVEGRAIDRTDRAGVRPVAVVNQTFVSRYWPGQSGIGRRIDQGDGWIEVVGVAADSAIDTRTQSPRPLVYRPWAQQPGNALTLHVRTRDREPLSLVEPIRRALADVHVDLPALDPGTLADHMQAAVFVPSVGARAFSVFGVIALLLAMAGLHGAVAQHLAERRREIAVIVALGASSSQVAAAISRPAIGLTLSGLVIGAAGSIATAWLARSQLVGIVPFDPLVIGVSLVTLAGTAAASCARPIWRATSADPTSMIRGG